MVQARHLDRYLWHALRAKCAPHRLDGWYRGRWNHQSLRCTTRENWPWSTAVISKKCEISKRHLTCPTQSPSKIHRRADYPLLQKEGVLKPRSGQLVGQRIRK